MKCSVDGKRCYSCPLDFFTLEKSVVSEASSMEGLPSILTTLFGSLMGDIKEMKIKEIHIEKTCVKKCPETMDEKPVKADLSRRICLIEDGNSLFSFLSPHDEEEKKDVLS